MVRPASGKRILVIDDDAGVRTLLHHVLVAAGYTVESVGTAGEARACLALRRYDLVLADDNLPDGRGVTIADEARASGMPAVVITGYGLRAAAEDLTRHEFLIKPVSPTELVQTVERQLADTSS